MNNNPIIVDYNSISRISLKNDPCVLWLVANTDLLSNFSLFFECIKDLNIKLVMVSGENSEEIHDKFDSSLISKNKLDCITTWHEENNWDEIIFDFMNNVYINSDAIDKIICLPETSEKEYFELLLSLASVAVNELE